MIKSYRQVVGRYSLQDEFNDTVRMMEDNGLSEEEVEELTSEVLVPEIAKAFAKSYVEMEQELSPQDALVEYCLFQGVYESLYERRRSFGKSTKTRSRPITMRWNFQTAKSCS